MKQLPGTVAVTPEVMDLLKAHAPVAVGISGGKDSTACAFHVERLLDEVGHAGPRVLAHADLGEVEWKQSLPMCERLAARLGWELIVVRRERGGLMERWEQRWASNVARYAALSCVKLILPWSTPDMRFCTSELKVDLICRELTTRWPGAALVNANGIRRQESPDRKKAPVSARQKKLETRGCRGLDWHPVIELTKDEVLDLHRVVDFPLHEGYEVYGSSRLSCVFCIMSRESDLVAAATCADNVEVGRRMVNLEIASTFAFHGSRWLGDVIAPVLLPDQSDRLLLAKEGAARRVEAESAIPRHLFYTKGWPTVMPSETEAETIASVRRSVSAVIGIEVEHTDGRSVLRRYEELMDLRCAKEGAAG